MTPACMGGWCRHRDKCANYHADDRSRPAERLCEKGDEDPVPIVFQRAPKETHERT